MLTIRTFCILNKDHINDFHIFAGKELGLVEEEKKCYLDIVGVSSTKRCGSGIVHLDDGWKLFCLGADPRMTSHTGVGILTSLIYQAGSHSRVMEGKMKNWMFNYAKQVL